jgi:Activator of Hsp90 ATPase homolog 1-like protein
VFNWGATDGWPKLDLERPDDSPRVTITLRQVGGRTELTTHVELPATLPDDGVPQWWPLVRNGWQDTVDRLAATFERTAAAR